MYTRRTYNNFFGPRNKIGRRNDLVAAGIV